MANDLTIFQASTILNQIYKQATGKTGIVATNTNEFVSVAQTTLKVGYDPLIQAINQVLSKTIMNIRPYSAKFQGMQVDNQKYGNMIRKLSIADKDFQDDGRLPLTDGQSVDMYKVNKPVILQMNYYGLNTYEKQYTIFKDQLDTAFSSPEEFMRFITMVSSNCNDMLEQARENMARATLGNFIAGKIDGDAENVIHLLTEYNAETGLTLTKAEVYRPENFQAFMQWAFARMATLSSLLTERSVKYHMNVTGKEISRHTPMENQKMYMYAPVNYQSNARVLANTFNEEYLKMGDKEIVNYWQSIDSPDSINMKPVYIDSNGETTIPVDPVVQSDVWGIMFDEEAVGYTIANQWSSPTPFNAKGGYTNIFFHESLRYWNDYTENAIVFLLD